MQNFNIEFGTRLREERDRLGLTQEEFARLGGVQKLAQHKYEKGDRTPSVEYLNAIEPYGINIGYLFSGSKGAEATTNIDVDLMQGIITELENSVDRLGLVVTTRKKARIIAMLYQVFHIQKRIDVKVVDEAVKISINETIDVRSPPHK
jgi:transcriptional regulator with XRE-family HTH domain